MLVIDGSFGEGGGQILRTSLTASLLTGTPFEMHAIRARRRRPGLGHQHLTAVRAAASVAGAGVQGASLGSDRLVFEVIRRFFGDVIDVAERPGGPVDVSRRG